jgi:hypothetical protein
MEYLALLMPAMTLAGLPLVDRLERWALSSGPTAAPAGSADPDPLTPTGSGELG